MNTLFIHETEYLEKVVFEFQIIPEILASSGHNVHVIDYPMHWEKKGPFDLGNFRTTYLYDVKKTGKKRGVTLIRPGVIKIPGLSRLLAFFEYFFLIGKVIKKFKIDHIVLLSVPTNGLQTLYWAKRYKVPIHFRLLDVLHQLVPAKVLSIPTFILEKCVYKRVSEISAITPKLTKYAIEMGGNSKTTKYIPTGSDLDFFYPQDKDRELLKKYGIKPTDQVVVFAGTLYNFSGLDVLLCHLANYPEHKKNLKMMILGRGQQGDLLKRTIKDNDLSDCVIMTGFIDYLELNKYINLADVCINPFEINKVTNIIFPSKIYQYAACEKPVIATRLAGAMEIFPDNGGKDNVFYFDLNKPEEFFQLLKKIGKQRVKDKNPSLQDIAKEIEKSLGKLKF